METAVTGISRLPVLKKVEKGRTIVTEMTNNENFPAPVPSLDTLTKSINELEAASLTAQKGGKDDTAAKRVKSKALNLLFRQLGSYVEGIANASPTDAVTIILSAGMSVKGKSVKAKQEFDVKPTGKPGEAKLTRKGVKRGTCEFQMTTDPTNEASWVRIYAGTRASFVKTGLVSGQRYYFRAASIDKNGIGAWSAVISMIAP